VPPESLRRVEPLLQAARDGGRANLAAIASAEASAHGLTVPQCLSYLRDNLHYHLGPDERLALSRFYGHAAKLDLAPTGLDVTATLAAR
jgi:chorismate dehydratase